MSKDLLRYRESKKKVVELVSEKEIKKYEKDLKVKVELLSEIEYLDFINYILENKKKLSYFKI